MSTSFAFLDNKYKKWYYQIISKAKTRIFADYYETHHIIPKCLGGTNYIENLVKLTAREHFICHWLLTKMVTGEARHKMLAALIRMSVQKNSNQQRIKPNGRLYEKIRSTWAKEHSKWLTGRFAGEKNPNFGNKMSEEVKNIIREKKIGKKLGPMSEEQKKKISIKQLGVPKNNSESIKKSWVISRDSRVGENHPLYGKSHSEESKIKMRESSAKRWTPEARATFSEKKKELNRLKRIKDLENAQT